MAPTEDRGVSRLQPPGVERRPDRACAGGRRLARDGCGLRRGDLRAAARRPQVRPSGPIPPGADEEENGWFGWWRRLPSGLLPAVLLGALVWVAMLTQGESLFNGYIALP